MATSTILSSTLVLEKRRKAVQSIKNTIHVPTMKQRHKDVLIGYSSLMVIISFLLSPFLLFLGSCAYFGLIGGIVLCLLFVVFNLVEGKLHPKRMVGRHWPAFQRVMGGIYDNFSNLLPLRVIKLGSEHDYSSKRQYMFCFHPHGILFLGPAAVALNWPRYFPGVSCSHLYSSMAFMSPFFRYFVLWVGGIPATKEAASEAILNRHSLSLIPGGLAEMLESDATPRRIEAHERKAMRICSDQDDDVLAKTIVLHLSHRKGFIAMALRHGLDLVPIFSFGEIDLYQQLQWGKRWRRKASRFFKVPLTFVWGRYFLFPFLNPIHIVIGKPIHVEKVENPTQAQIDNLHKVYVQALCSIFTENREKYGHANARLIVH